MIDVTVYIRELLFSHDCVILPSFGGFIGNYTPARIDRATNSFYPPVKSISFNRNLNNNDGLLISRISADRSIGYADAKRFVDEFVDDVRSKLNKGERVTFDLIGYFQNNNEGNVQFEPDTQSNYLLDSYGLGPFNREPVADYDVGSRVLKRVDRGTERHFSRKMIWRAAIAVPFVLAMVFVPLKTNLFRNTASLNPLASTEMDSMAGIKQEAPSQDKDLIVDENIVAEPVAEDAVNAAEADIPDESVKTVAAVTEPIKEYFLITGSFRSESNAMRQKADLVSKGYQAEISSAPNGYYRVTASAYSSYSDASTAKKAIVSDYPGTWILMK